MEKERGVLKVKKLVKDAELPEYVLATDVGLDLKAGENISLEPYEQKTVKTGVAVSIPEGCVGLIRDRVGIVTKMGVHTAAGTFDPAYRGEISVVLVNFGDEAVEIEKGMRIAQMIILPVVKVQVKEVKDLGETERGDKLGVSGTKEILRDLFHIKKGKKVEFE